MKAAYMFKKVFSGFLLLLSAVFFLALQGPKETTDLSNRAWQAAQRIGYTGTPQQIRSDIHLMIYFMVGLAAILFCKAMGWKLWIGLVAACIIGLLEETLKICLPTREFSWIDAVKDCIGAGIAFFIYSVTVHFQRH